MMDLDQVQKLYSLQTDQSATDAERQKARERIAQIADDLVDQYLATLIRDIDGPGASPSNKKGQPKFENYGALYCRTLIGANCAENIYGVPEETDKVGTVLLHRKYTSAGH